MDAVLKRNNDTIDSEETGTIARRNDLAMLSSDYLKHLTTLSSATLLFLVGFVLKGKEFGLFSIYSLSLICFIVSLICALIGMFYAMLISKGATYETKDWQYFACYLVASMLGYCLGLIAVVTSVIFY